jgi:hypothetical protein
MGYRKEKKKEKTRSQMTRPPRVKLPERIHYSSLAREIQDNTS